MNVEKFLAPVFLLALFFISGSANTVVAQVPILEYRAVLISRLDSIALEKQQKKRAGKSIKALDNRADQLKDSIANLIQLIEAGEEYLPEPPRKNILQKIKMLTGNSLIQPKNFFDWLILIIGAIAVLSVVVLIVSVFLALLKKVFGGPRRPKKVKSKSKPMHTMKNGLNSSMDAYFSKKTEEEAGLEKLRQRIAKTRKENEAAKPSVSIERRTVPVPEPIEKKGKPASHSKSDSETVDTDIRRKVIRAARQGTSIQEIARQCQLSADHVALILKIAVQEAKKKSNR